MAGQQNLQLPCNVHIGLPFPPGANIDNVELVTGDYEYYHYICDGLDDRGWGCGYRTLQTMCSWSRFQLLHHDQVDGKREINKVPSIPEIQQALVAMQDKPTSHLGSRDWIGSVEVGLCIDYLYDIPCKIVHISSGQDLPEHKDMLAQHFHTKGGPIMMGGDSDAASKGVLGICSSDQATYLLILDPHYYGACPDQKTLTEHDMLIWRPLDWFQAHSFYNLCLPQYTANKLR